MDTMNNTTSSNHCRACEDNEENYHLTNISYKWVLNLSSDHDNGSDIFHGGSLQTNDRMD